MSFEDLLNRIVLKTGQILTQTWFENLRELFEYIKTETGIESRLPLSKMPDGEYGKVLIAQGIGNDPVYADPDCNIVKVSGTSLTPRDWSLDFEKLQNLDIAISQIKSKLEDIESKLDFERYDSALLTKDVFFKKVLEGKAFHFSYRFENVANNASVNVYIRNPPNSGKNIFVILSEVSTLGNLRLNAYRNPTITEEGSDIPFGNLKLDANTTPVAIVRRGATFSETTSVFKAIIGGGTKTNVVGATASVGEGIIIPPNYVLLVEFVNVSGGTTEFSFRMMWFEEEIS